MDQRQGRIFEIAGDAHLFAEQRVVEHPRRIGHLGGECEEQEHVGDVQRPAAMQHFGGGEREAPIQENAGIDQRRGVAGDEDEDLGGVAQTIVPQR